MMIIPATAAMAAAISANSGAANPVAPRIAVPIPLAASPTPVKTVAIAVPISFIPPASLIKSKIDTIIPKTIFKPSPNEVNPSELSKLSKPVLISESCLQISSKHPDNGLKLSSKFDILVFIVSPKVFNEPFKFTISSFVKPKFDIFFLLLCYNLFNIFFEIQSVYLLLFIYLFHEVILLC
ncbi:hypothetical protein IMSAG013_00906 [Clostridiales bacterium]|nr:hypothetical protein IMSAG013_00906 [Clostridiales bacterium]